MKDLWTYFLLQVFSYGALDPEAQQVHLVLPLQEMIWSYDLSQWTKRQLFRQTLENFAEKLQLQLASQPSIQFSQMIFQLYPIGYHINKKIIDIDLDSGLPWQIFLNGSATTHLNISDHELASLQQYITNHNVTIFIHASYLINLCSITDYNCEYLSQLLDHARLIGARGVVVHVGKRTKLSETDAMNNMTLNLLDVLDHASEQCPLLLETPAGQGTEVLVDSPETFTQYCAQFETSKLGICLDTCHVYASGLLPSVYLSRTQLNLLKLIHLNDSSRDLNSHVDRHEQCGLGKIGVEDLLKVAQIATQSNIPMIHEV
jgi:deoxyribonuclease-4